MKIQRLHIKGFRNINDLDLDLSNQDGLSVLIGNNGSGKSNLLEAIVSIFASLYNKANKFKPQFDYDITYTLNGHCIKVEESGSKTFVDNMQCGNRVPQEHLPKNIIACYSGETTRLQEDFFTPFRKKFIWQKITNKPADIRLLFINKDMWDIALLTLFLYSFKEFTDIQTFCCNTLNIQQINNIHININPLRLTHNNEAKQIIDSIWDLKQSKSADLTFQEFKEIIDRLGFSQKDVFMALYVGIYAHGITSVNIDIALNNGTTINANLLSEGEKKLLSIFTMLEVLGDESSLMIYDEPDSQIHISRKGEIKTLVEKYSNRQHIITTHSPTLASAFFDSQEHLLCLRKDKGGICERIDKDKFELIAELTNNLWSVSEQNTFLASTKPITLLVEGKTDKIHIETAFRKLKDDYPNLDFDVYHFGGADNIPHFIIGLKTCEIDLTGRTIIAIFDNDTEGRNCCNQTTVKYSSGKKNKSGLYAIVLPTGTDSTIENLYDLSKYHQAYIFAVNNNVFKGLVSDYTKNVTMQAKIELSKIAHDFPKEDFDGFKCLFDKIKEISKLK